MQRFRLIISENLSSYEKRKFLWNTLAVINSIVPRKQRQAGYKVVRACKILSLRDNGKLNLLSFSVE